MSIIQAVYRHGVFEPLKPVDLPEEQHVEVHVAADVDKSAAKEAAIDKWFDDLKAMQADFVAKHGYLPDSTPDIAEDRMR